MSGAPSELRFDVTVDPGLEDVAGAEAQERFQEAGISAYLEEKPLDLSGHIEVGTTANADVAGAVLRRLHSAYYVVRLYDSVVLAVDPGETAQHERPEAILEPVYRRLKALELPELEAAASFCVRTRRVGKHPFSSPEVERRAGEVLRRRFGTKVDLTSPECTVRVDITDSIARVGILYGGDTLNKRFPWVWRPRVTLRNTIAYGMLRLGGYDSLPSGGTLLDPFCGSGTILVEGASLRDDVTLLGSDWDEAAIEGARANIEACGYNERITVSPANALEIDRIYGEKRVSLIVTNPPFGVRMAKDTNMLGFYHSFLRAARRVVKPGGKLVILVGRKRKLFNTAIAQLDEWNITHVRIIEFGGVYPGLFVLE